MGRGYGGAVMKAFGAQEHTITVVSVEDITPRFRRIVVDAPTFFDGKQIEPACFVRLWAPDPEHPGREHQRGYTVVDPDPELRRFSLDFVLHEPSGPASSWARSAAPGDAIQLSYWASPHFTVPDPAPDGYLLIGDAASVPGINAILATIPPKTPVVVLLEQHDEDDLAIPVYAHPQCTVSWLPYAGDAGVVAAAIGTQDWSNWYAWVTGETTTAKLARARLKELGFPKPDVHGRAYWTKGKAMGTDRHQPAASGSAPAAVEATEQEAAGPVSAPTPDRWRSRAGARLLAPLRSRLMLAGVFQAVVSLLQLAPFVLLAEVCRRLLAGNDDLAGLGLLALALMGAGTILAGVLVVAMHVVDARFGLDVRTRVVTKLSRLPLGWFGEQNSGKVKQAVQDDTTDLHYLVTHAVLDVVAALISPLAVLAYLFTVSPGLAAILLIPLLAYVILSGRMIQLSASQLTRFTTWETRVGGEAIAYLDGLTVARIYDAGPAAGFRATLSERARFLDDWQRPLSGRKTLVRALVVSVLVGGSALVFAPAQGTPGAAGVVA
ncbi:SIP domain-containing protein, partial [Hamadaea sp. NPDC051192]|uniref:SIP domain-containing protein n=1 Tax=Hamadaea sp. NPDC051192 TaxID=3154940 RepID=UPI0034397718